MQQQFHTRNYSVRDFQEWHDRHELVLAPKFQRREVWSDKAKSFLIDTILRGKPIPKLYMRQDIALGSKRTVREIVDGQQRLRAVLSFIADGFRIHKVHHEEFGGKYFSGLPTDVQRDMLKYEFVVDLLQDMPDSEVYDMFARINTYQERLKYQELRNAQWFGEFKTSVYSLAREFTTFFETARIFSSKQILRMAEAELVSELLLAQEEGIREKKQSILDAAYKKYDDTFPNRRGHERAFRENIDAIGAILGDSLPSLSFRATRLFYPLYCAIHHHRVGLSRVGVTRIPLKAADYPKLKTALERVEVLLQRIRAAEEAQTEPTLSLEERRFFDAYREHWVHADNRAVLTQYLAKELARAVRG